MSKQKQTIMITAIIFLFVGIVVGMITNQVFVGGNRKNTFQDGWNAAEQRLVETGFVSTINMEEMGIRFITGEIKEINNSKIILKIRPLSPLADPELDTRIIETVDAKVYQLIGRDQVEFQKETEEFNQKIQIQMENPEMVFEPISPPEMFIKQEIKLSDLKVGQQITVEAEEDMKGVKQFEAKEIILQFSPIMPEALNEEVTHSTDDNLPTE